MTVEQNIAAGLTGKKVQKMRRVGEMIERFQLEGLEKQLPSELSGGQQQRVALARILAYEPEVLLLDEPFSALDAYLKDQMQRELMEMLQSYPGIVILVSHSRDEVYRMSEELLILDAGTIVGQGPSKQIFAAPGNVAAARLTGCKNITEVCRTDAGFYSKDWKMEFPVFAVPESGIGAIGIHSHQFTLKETGADKQLVFPVFEPVVTEDLFEYNVSFKTSKEASGRIDWKVSKDIWKHGKDAMPELLYLKLSDVLFMKKV